MKLNLCKLEFLGFKSEGVSKTCVRRVVKVTCLLYINVCYLIQLYELSFNILSKI